jgi:hypothetical protein
MGEMAKERRRARRSRVMLAGAIVHNRQRYPCRIRDLSVGGLKVVIDVPLAPGTPVHAELPRFGRFPAVVAWVEGRMMGLVFPERASDALARFGPSAVKLGLVDTDVAAPVEADGVAQLPRR